MASTTTTHSRKAPVDLAPIVKTVMLPGRSGHLECWSARTVDGLWEFDRAEDTATTWEARHRPSVADGSFTGPVFTAGNLRQCRAAVACGAAGEELAMRLEEKRQQGQRLAEVRASCLAAGIRPVRPGEASPEPVGADREPGDLNGGAQ